MTTRAHSKEVGTVEMLDSVQRSADSLVLRLSALAANLRAGITGRRPLAQVLSDAGWDCAMAHEELVAIDRGALKVLRLMEDE